VRRLLIYAAVLFVLMVGSALLPDDLLFAVALFAAIPLLLAWGALLVWYWAVAVGSFRRKKSLTALICLALPFAVPFTAYEAILYVQYPADYAHFQAMRSSYDAQVARLPKDGKRYAEFNWGGMLFASSGVVYDETDEVALPHGHQSIAWKKRMRNTDLTCGGDGPVGKVMRLIGHYYVTAFGC
jgi:hypothetical protein